MPSKAEIEKRIATMGDPKSNGKWREFVEKNKAAEKAKPRQENVIERIDRINYEFGNSKERPKHLDNKSIYSFEDQKIFKNNINKKPTYPNEATPTQVGNLAKRLEESRQSTGELNTWELMKKTAHTSEEKNELKRILNKQYYKRGPKDMDPEDLKYIGKHKSQIVYPEIKIPHVEPDLTNKPTRQPEPRIPIEQTIKILADKRLDREQRAWDHQHGRSGITDLLRPK